MSVQKTIYSSIIILLLCALVGGFFMYLIAKDTLECNKNEQICVLKNNGRVIKKFPVSDIQNGLSLDVSGPQIHHSGRAGESYDWIYSLSLQTQSGSLLLFRNVDSYECLLFGFFCPVIGGKEYDENSSAYVDILSKKEQIETFPKNANENLIIKSWRGEAYWVSMMLIWVSSLLLALFLLKRKLAYRLIDRLISSTDVYK